MKNEKLIKCNLYHKDMKFVKAMEKKMEVHPIFLELLGNFLRGNERSKKWVTHLNFLLNFLYVDRIIAIAIARQLPTFTPLHSENVPYNFEK